MRSLGMKLLAFAAIAITTSPVFAQSDSSGAKADVVVELRPSQIIDSPLGKKMDFAGKLAALPKGPTGPDFSEIKRVFIGLVAPANSESFEEIQQGLKNDMQFFTRLEFASADAASKMMESMKEDNAGETEKNGQTYYTPSKDSSMADGTVFFQVNEKTVEMASDGFAYRTSQMPFTDALTTAWKAMPDSALKVSIDGVNARELLKSLVKEGKKNAGGNPIVGAVMDLFPTMDNINLTFDLASADLLTLHMTGADADKTTDINDGFKSLMTLAKPLAKQGLAVVQAQAPQPAAVFGSIIDGMDVKQSGNNVTLNIPRPEGFEGAVEEFVPMAQGIVLQMMMGGAGGAGGPNGF